jgi:hypothetical protein
MYDTKLLVTESDKRVNHLKDTKVDMGDRDIVFLDTKYSKDGYTPHKTLCGETSCFKLTVINETEKANMCSECLMEAWMRRLNYSQYVPDENPSYNG